MYRDTFHLGDRGGLLCEQLLLLKIDVKETTVDNTLAEWPNV